MKKTILILSLLSAQFLKAQNIKESVSYISPLKDTLMLPNNDLGQIIRDVWISKPINNTPIIILVSESKIARMKEINYYSNKNK